MRLDLGLRPSRAIPLLAAAAALTLGAPGCSSPATQLLVVVNTDITVPGDMRLVRATVRNLDSGDYMTSQEFVVNAHGAATTGELELPFSFGVVPKGGDASRRVAVIIEGFRTSTSDPPIVTRLANTGFLEGKTLLLPMFLYASCIDVSCTSADLTCIDGACRPAYVDPSTLREVAPGRELDDAGGGAGMDAARPDGASDAGSDAGPPPECTVDDDCDDRDRCNGAETCLGGRCAPGVSLDCVDGFVCTVDRCEALAGCVHSPDDTVCGSAAGDFCDPMSGCQHATCDAASCQPEAGSCQVAMCSGATCLRTTSCSASQTCCAGACVAAGCDDGNPCTDDRCGGGGCEHVNNRNPCDDGLGCTAGDACVAGACVGADTCSNSDACDGVETCTSGGCAPGTPVYCDDLVSCTDDSCTPATGACVHTRNDTLCTAAAGGTCDAVRDCQYPMCTPMTCTPTMGCQQADCMGSMCVRTSLCGAGQMCCGSSCVAAGCEDGNPCTDGSCSAGACAQTPNTVPCNDGNDCTGPDVCAVGTCGGAAVVCNDGNPCTNDSCVPGSGCQFVFNSMSCDDMTSCTSGDHCTSGMCIGTYACADGDPCTIEMCLGATCSTTPTLGCAYFSMCLPVGAPQPDNECLVCTDDGADGYALLPAPSGTLCGGGLGCCNAGACGSCGIDAGIGPTLDAGGLFDAGRDAAFFFDAGTVLPPDTGGTFLLDSGSTGM